MAQNLRDVEKAKIICADIVDKVRFPCGNPIGGTWAPPASLMDGDMRTTIFWEQNGELCLRKGEANVEFERTRELLTTQNSRLMRLKSKIVEQIRKDNQAMPGLGSMHYFEDGAKKGWFSRIFPAFYKLCVQEAGNQSEKKRTCGYCGAVEVGKAGWVGLAHDKEKACASKPQRWKWVETEVAFSSDIHPDLVAMKEGDFIKEPDFKLAKFRCNDHAAIIIQRLLDVNVETPFEILRMGRENKESQFHYFVVMGRDTGKAADGEGNIQPGEANPLEVLGEYAVIIDPWSTKHGPDFSRFPLEMGGINAELSRRDKWFVAPRSFPGLFPVCAWPGTARPDRTPQPYRGAGVGQRERVR